MGTHDLIDDYLARLAAATRWHPDPDSVVDEMADHLMSASEAREAAGASPTEAQRAALAQFGEPEAVARALAVGPQGQLAVPTRSTVSGGAIAVVAGAMWVVYVLASFAVIHLYDRVEGDSAADSSTPLGLLVMLPWFVGLLAGMVLLIMTALILKDRQGGFRWMGWLGLIALGLGTAASLMGWFLPGWTILLAVGAALLGAELVDSGIAPRRPSIGLAAGPATGLAVWAVLRVAELGSPDQYGDYPVATFTGIAVGSAILAGSLAGLGRWLRSEDPVEVEAAVVAPDAVTPA